MNSTKKFERTVIEKEKKGGHKKYFLQSYNDKRIYIFASHSKLLTIECPLPLDIFVMEETSYNLRRYGRAVAARKLFGNDFPGKGGRDSAPVPDFLPTEARASQRVARSLN